MTVKELIEHLQQFEDHDAPIAYMVWQLDDVFHLQQQMDLDENVEVATEVINTMEKYKDASDGMSWDVLKTILYDVLEEREKAA